MKEKISLNKYKFYLNDHEKYVLEYLMSTINTYAKKE